MELQLVCRNWAWGCGWPVWISSVMCATVEERNTGLKLGGKMIPLNLKNHFLVLSISIHALLYLALGNIELENRGICLISSYLFSFLVAVLSPPFPKTFSYNDKSSSAFLFYQVLATMLFQVMEYLFHFMWPSHEKICTLHISWN